MDHAPEERQETAELLASRGLNPNGPWYHDVLEELLGPYRTDTYGLVVNDFTEPFAHAGVRLGPLYQRGIGAMLFWHPSENLQVQLYLMQVRHRDVAAPYVEEQWHPDTGWSRSVRDIPSLGERALLRRLRMVLAGAPVLEQIREKEARQHGPPPRWLTSAEFLADIRTALSQAARPPLNASKDWRPTKMTKSRLAKRQLVIDPKQLGEYESRFADVNISAEVRAFNRQHVFRLNSQ